MPTSPYSHTLLLLLLCALASAQKPNVEYGHPKKSCTARNPQQISIDEFMRNLPSKDPAIVECGEQLIVDSSGDFSFPHGLVIDGELIFNDGLPTPVVISTIYVLVRGLLRMGTKKRSYEGSVKFILNEGENDLNIPNTSGNRLFNQLTGFGKKAFVCYGGSIQIYGHANGPAFVHLTRTVVPGDSHLTVSADVSNDWKKGDQIAVASTNNPYDESPSQFTIRRVQQINDKSTRIHLDGTVGEFHTVRTVRLTNTNAGTRVVLAPEVSKINRNIMIQGMPVGTDFDEWLDENEVEPIGGHFVLANSPFKQIVQGVEFVGMGQAGTLGRYPLHLHFLADVDKDTRISRNSVHHSKQRAVVVHATNNAMIEENVAFKIAGHGYVIEEGLEEGNQFIGNIAMAVRAAVKVIDDGGRNEQSDNDPAGFWMASPANDYVGNVAAGSIGSGFWYELDPDVRGQSRDMQLPGWSTTDMRELTFGKFEDNVAHSARAGLQTYPDGSFPKKTATFSRLLTWSTYLGWQTNVGINQVLKDSYLLDVFQFGIHSDHIVNFRVENVVISGEWHYQWTCDENTIVEGIHFEGNLWRSSWYEGMQGVVLKNVHFQDFDKNKNCGTNIGIKFLLSSELEWMPSSTSLSGISFKNVDIPMAVSYEHETYRPMGFMTRKVGLNPFKRRSGFAITDGFVGQNVLAKSCRKTGLDGMLFCAGQCWRHVTLAYKELEGYGRTRVRFRSSKLGTFEETPEVFEQYVSDGVVDRIVTKLMPSGTYRIELIDADGHDVPDDEYSTDNVFMYRADSRNGYKPVCKKDVIFRVHGKEMFEAI